MGSASVQENILEIKDISKKYPGVIALKNVSFNIKRNCVHCIIGENGAGKSTLIKILTGAEQRSGGLIHYNGEDFNPRNTRHAMNLGMSVIFQELNIIEQLSVAENLTLGVEKTKLGVIQRYDESSEAFTVLKKLEPGISFRQKVSDLSVAKKQVIEIAKAIAANSSVLIMDEPTAALSEDEVQRLFSIIKELHKENVTIIYISHRLEEIFEIGDYVTVLRDGEVIDTKAVKQVPDRSELIKMMIGKVVAENYVTGNINNKLKVLEVSNLSTETGLDNINFDLYQGEILGFYGLIGSGKSEIARAIYGADRISSGKVTINGNPIKLKTPKDSIKKGIAMVPEERRSAGILSKLNIRDNITVMNAKKISQFWVINRKKEREISRKYIRDLSIATKGMEQIVATLSGGNQQKVVLAKCLNADSKILIMDEPTRGIDVGAKEEIHKIIRRLSLEGNSVLVFSSELPEIINLCDRIILLYEGRIKSIIKNDELDSEQIMHIVTGGMDSGSNYQ
jgi:ABC-type sugar transport system ATPase subunit